MEEFKTGDRVSHPKFGEGIIDSDVYLGYQDWYSVDFGISGCWVVEKSKLTKVEETKEMTSYKVGDIVEHKTYNESIIIDISKFEKGSIEIVPLTGDCRGKVKSVIIENLKKIDEFLISTENYNEMVDTIEKLKEKNQKLKNETVKHFEIGSRVFNKKYGYGDVREIGCYNFGITVMFDNCGSRVVPSDDLEIVTDRERGLVNHIAHLRNKICDLQEKLYVAGDKTKCAEAKLAINTLFGYKLPEVKEVLYHKPATIIFWKDGTKTVVKAQKKEKYDKEKGFVMAYLKKILGNEGNYYEEIKRWTEE